MTRLTSSPDRFASPLDVSSVLAAGDQCASSRTAARLQPRSITSREIALAPVSSVHRPSFSMRIGTGSYRLRSRCLMMDAAEATDTSCSPDRPP